MLNFNYFETKNKNCNVHPQYILDLGKVVFFVYFDSFFIIERVGRKRIPYGILHSQFNKIGEESLPEELQFIVFETKSSHKYRELL